MNNCTEKAKRKIQNSEIQEKNILLLFLLLLPITTFTFGGNWC